MNTNDAFEIEIEGKKIEITKQDVDDIMDCALEGGITYWCCSAVVIEDDYYGEYASEQISRGGSLRLYDAESYESFILTLEKLLNGIILAYNDGYAENWFEDDKLDTFNIDGEVADIIVQYALFEELVYG